MRRPPVTDTTGPPTVPWPQLVVEALAGDPDTATVAKVWQGVITDDARGDLRLWR